MLDNDHEQPFESDDDALKPGGGDGANGGDERANSADSGQNAQPDSPSIGNLSHVDQSLSKIDKLSAAMAKLAKASADRSFSEKIKELVKEADEVDRGVQEDSQQSSEKDVADQETIDSDSNADPDPGSASNESPQSNASIDVSSDTVHIDEPEPQSELADDAISYSASEVDSIYEAAQEVESELESESESEPEPEPASEPELGSDISTESAEDFSDQPIPETAPAAPEVASESAAELTEEFFAESSEPDIEAQIPSGGEGVEEVIEDYGGESDIAADTVDAQGKQEAIDDIDNSPEIVDAVVEVGGGEESVLDEDKLVDETDASDEKVETANQIVDEVSEPTELAQEHEGEVKGEAASGASEPETEPLIAAEIDEIEVVAESVVEEDVTASTQTNQPLDQDVLADIDQGIQADSKYQERDKAQIEDETIKSKSSSHETSESGDLPPEVTKMEIDESGLDVGELSLVDQVLELGETSSSAEVEDQRESDEVDVDVVKELNSLQETQLPANSDSNEAGKVDSIVDSSAAKLSELNSVETPFDPELAPSGSTEQETFSAEQISGQISQLLETLDDSKLEQQPKRPIAKASAATDFANLTDSPSSSNADLQKLTGELNDLMQGKAANDTEESEIKQSQAAVAEETQADDDQTANTDAGNSVASVENEPTQEPQSASDEIQSLIESVEQSTDDLVDQSQVGDSDLDEISAQLDDILNPGDNALTEESEVEETVETQGEPQNADPESGQTIVEDAPGAVEQQEVAGVDVEADSESKPVATEEEIDSLASQIEELVASDSQEDSEIEGESEDQKPSVDAADKTIEQEESSVDSETTPTEDDELGESFAEESSTDESISNLDEELSGQVEGLMQTDASQETDEVQTDDSQADETNEIEAKTDAQLDTQVSEDDDTTSDSEGEESFASTDDKEPSDEAEEQIDGEAFADESVMKETDDEEASDEDKKEDGKKSKATKQDDRDEDDEDEDENSKPGGRLRKLVFLQTALSRIEPFAVPALEKINYPLRYVPEKMRPIVDWIALSTLFWVPIVWMIALLSG